MNKREDYLSWDEYFMAIAILAAMRSKDPSTQVGACIVNTDNRILGTGYNGFPRGCSDDELPWGREGEYYDTKYPYVVHAEPNALANKVGDVTGCRIYVDLFPCHECAKLLIQAGIVEVIYRSDKYADTDSVKAAKVMFNMAKVQLRQFLCTSKMQDIRIC